MCHGHDCGERRISMNDKRMETDRLVSASAAMTTELHSKVLRSLAGPPKPWRCQLA